MFSRGLLLVIAAHQLLVKSEDVEEVLLGKSMEALSKTFDFALYSYESMNIDGMLGINTAIAHLVKAREETRNKSLIDQLQILANKAQLIYWLQEPNLPTSPYKYYVFVNFVIPPKFWMKDISFTHGKLNPNPVVDTGEYDISKEFDYYYYVLTSRFDEKKSDACLVEVTTGSNETQPHFCPISQNCTDYMMRIPTGYSEKFPGYGATHMLLFLQLAKIKNCQFNFTIEGHIEYLCSYILWELRTNVQFGYIPQMMDLFCEQIVLCGFEGYAEFLKKEYLEYILQEQESHGGFGIELEDKQPEQQRYRFKRESTSMEYGTNSHTTGLAANALALFIRLMVNKPFEGRAFHP